MVGSLSVAETTKISVSLPAHLAERAREAAGEDEAGNLSAWFARLAEREVRRRESLEAVRAFENAHGELTEDEVASARARWLG